MLLETDNMPKDDSTGDNLSESNLEQKPFQQPSNKHSMPTIAGILLIIAGVFTILFWIPVITLDISLIESTGILSRLHEVDPTITAEQVKGLLVVCGTIGCILSVFPILGGLFSLKRKMWGMALTGGILGLSTIFPAVFPGILSLIGLILIGISKEEFQ